MAADIVNALGVYTLDAVATLPCTNGLIAIYKREEER
jgi:hypothetical protein